MKIKLTSIFGSKRQIGLTSRGLEKSKGSATSTRAISYLETFTKYSALTSTCRRVS